MRGEAPRSVALLRKRNHWYIARFRRANIDIAALLPYPNRGVGERACDTIHKARRGPIQRASVRMLRV